MSRALVKRPTTLPATFAQGSQKIARIKDLISEAAETEARYLLEAGDAQLDDQIEDAVVITVDLAAQDTDAVPLVRTRRATAAYSTSSTEIPVIRDIISIA